MKIKYPNIHFVGIGGIGMSGIARLFHQMGYRVSGSDVKENDEIRNLRQLGMHIAIGHREENVAEAHTVVYSSAVTEDNVEIRVAREKKLAVCKRAEMLGELMRDKAGICVAGAHGKTTTTTVAYQLFKELGYETTSVIGGIVKSINSNIFSGNSDYFLCEADESDGSFLSLNPIYTVITNIDAEHLNYFSSLSRIMEYFVQFAQKVPFYGHLIINRDDPLLQKAKKAFGRRFFEYSLVHMDADYFLDSSNEKLSFYHQGVEVLSFSTNFFGQYNLSNLCASLSLMHSLGLDFLAIKQKGVLNLELPLRRFTLLREKENLVWVDDYAHHPTEITAVLKGVRESRFREHRVTAIFQPHRYSRLQSCYDDFLACFAYADQVLVLPVYAAHEIPIEGINSEKFVADLKQKGVKQVAYASDFNQCRELLLSDYGREKYKPQLWISLGAGDVNEVLKRFTEKHPEFSN